MPAITFIGEVELTDASQESFVSFDGLPLEGVIRRLAKQFTGEIEIMPYQKQGGPLQMAFSVYLSSEVRRDGKVIAILVKESYPRTIGELRSTAETARSRIRGLKSRVPKISEASIIRARKSIDRLLTAVEKEEGRKR